MPGLFVTATGTEVGKTTVTCGLIRAARRAGRPVTALKPVLTGYDPVEASASDAGRLLAAMGRPVTAEAVASISPWRYAAPLSPDIAAAAEGRAAPDLVAVAAFCRAGLAPEHLTLIEGIGGAMVPLDRRHTVLDLMADLAAVPGVPILLVAPTALGAISHALTAMAALAGRGLAPAMVLLVESASSAVPMAATRDTLAAFCPGLTVATLPRDPPEAAFDPLLAALAPSRRPRSAA